MQTGVVAGRADTGQQNLTLHPSPMKSCFSLFAILSLCLCMASSCFGWDELIDVTPKNQRDLGLDFSITSRSFKGTFIVDLVIPPASALKDLASVGVALKSDPTGAITGLTIPSVGLTHFSQKSTTDPEQVASVYGTRLSVGKDSVPRTSIWFIYDNNRYTIQLSDYVRK